MTSTAWLKKTSNLIRGKAAGHRRLIVAGVAATTLWGGIGVPPASAETYGSPLPNYDAGVNGTLNFAVADCGTVLYELPNYQGKKLCGPALGDAFFTQLVSLGQSQVASLGGDMNWTYKVSSVTVRPGFNLELWNLGTSRSYLEDTPDLGDFNDKATAFRVGAYNWGEGNNNSAAGHPVTTKNAAPCASSQGPEKAVDRSVASIYTTKWCGISPSPLAPWLAPPTLQVDLGADRLITGVVVHHAGDGPLDSLLGLGLLKGQRESDVLNTKNYKVKIASSPDGPWTLVGSFVNNWNQDVSNHRLTCNTDRLCRARYVQLEINLPSTIDGIARIQEFEVLTLNR